MKVGARNTTASLGRVAQLRSTFGFFRLRLGFGFDRFDSSALDPRGFDPHGNLGPRPFCRLLRPMQRTRPRRGAGHQHLGRALVTEIAIREAHTGNRSAEADFVLLVEIEAGLERDALDRGAYRLAADLKRIAR